MLSMKISFVLEMSPTPQPMKDMGEQGRELNRLRKCTGRAESDVRVERRVSVVALPIVFLRRSCFGLSQSSLMFSLSSLL